MNKLFFHIVVPAMVISAAFSCNKYLTLVPQDGIIRQEYWKTKEEIQSAVVGCYASLLGDPANADRPLPEYLFVWGETRTDMVGAGLGITSDELDLMNVNTLSTNAFAKWGAVYRTINYCNTVLDFAPAVLQTDNTLTQTQLKAWLSEVKAMRALMYFYLVRTFRDVPLKLTSTASDDDLQQLKKTSGDSVMVQVVSDLAYADSNAVVTFGNSATDKGRITKYTVKAIEADVFLWLERYTDCENACNYIINSGNFGLIAGDGGWFNTLYYQGNSNESIFEFQFDAQKLNSFYNMFTTTSARYLASANVMDNVFTIDYFNDQDVDIRGGGASVRTSDNTIWKYLGVNAAQLRTPDASYAHWFVYRYADILLMKAEAINQEGGRGADALALVTLIRNRAHALAQTNNNPDPTDQDGVADFILQERAREFAFEGKRWFDVLRNAKRNNYARLSVLLNMAAVSVPPELQQSAIGKYHDPDSHYLPVPYSEILTDPNLVQNPFYK